MKYTPDEKRDGWFERQGIKKPEARTHFTEEDLKEMLASQRHACKWKQKGGEMFCDEGEHRHGKRIKPTEMLHEGRLVPVGPLPRD